MKKENRFEINDYYKRFQTDWLFQWDIKNPEEGILFNVYGDYSKEETWTLNGNETTKTLGDLLYNYQDGEILETNSEWRPYPIGNNSPILEYDSQGVTKVDDKLPTNEKWDEAHPNNITRFLRPGEFVKKENTIIFGNGIYTVVLDTEPPKFVTDKGINGSIGTQYKTINSNTRHCEFIFKDGSGIDFKQFTISIGDTIYYEYNRKTEEYTILNDHIENILLKLSTDASHYCLSFTLRNVEDDDLNNNHLKIKIWDLAGNESEFIINKKWKNFKTDELTNLLPVVIKYFNTVPENLQLKPNVSGETWVDIYNPNVDTWDIFTIMFELTKDSLGIIDESTIYDDEYETTGHIKFKVYNINEIGSVITDGWLYFGSDYTTDALLKEITFAEAILGPWICPDPEGRLYNFKPYVPSILKDTPTEEFVDFLQYFMNTPYTGLSNNKNISVLEKIARINDFNDIDKLENNLLSQYGNQFGNEITLNFDTFKNIYKKELNNEKEGFEIQTEENLIDVFKYILKNLPNYNQIKGSFKGVSFILKMLGLTCKIEELWIKANKKKINPDFKTRDEIINDVDISKYFLTSYFKINIIAGKNFSGTTKNLEFLKKIVNEIKPINKILYSIDYNTESEKENYVFVSDATDEDIVQEELSYTFNYEIDSSDINLEQSNGMPTVSEIYFPYNCDIDVDGETKENNSIGVLKEFFESEKPLKIYYGTDDKTCDLNEEDYGIDTLNDGFTIKFNKFKQQLIMGMYIKEVRSNDQNACFKIKINDTKGSNAYST